MKSGRRGGGGGQVSEDRGSTPKGEEDSPPPTRLEQIFSVGLLQPFKLNRWLLYRLGNQLGLLC